MNDDVTRASKFLAYVLRHNPAAIGLDLGEGGWVRIDALDGIFADGLRPGARTHVHLSASTEAAATVGARRGRPVALVIDTAAMSAGGHEFFQASNGVWLTSHVPPAFISFDGARPGTGQAKSAGRGVSYLRPASRRTGWSS